MGSPLASSVKAIVALASPGVPTKEAGAAAVPIRVKLAETVVELPIKFVA